MPSPFEYLFFGGQDIDGDPFGDLYDDDFDDDSTEDEED